MPVLFNQHWDVAPERTQAYSEDFVMGVYNPTLTKVGLDLVGGYYVTVGMGPRIIVVARTQTMSLLETALESPEFESVTRTLLEYVTSYHSKILVPVGSVDMTNYEVHSGLWKYVQYWNVLPARRREYGEFMEGEFVPLLEEAGIPLSGRWRVVVGAGPQMLTESSAGSIVLIAKALEKKQFRRAVRKLKTTYVTDYHSRILHPTGRVEMPKFLNEMLGSF